MNESPVLLERSGRAASLTLARPPHNILDLELIAALDRALDELAASQPPLQLVILRGAGGRAFSTGVAVQDHTADKIDRMLISFHGAIRKLVDLPALALAVVEGHCLGGGMELALACDLVLAAADARFGQPEIRLGCYPPVAAALYPALLGVQRATELLVTGRTLTAEEARDWGFVNWVAPAHELEAKLGEVTEQLIAHSAPVLALTKRALAAGRRLPFREALAEAERIYLEELARTDDMHEGIEAFLEKRPPRWRHR